MKVRGSLCFKWLWMFELLAGYSRVRREPDTIILRGVPSRWFAEPRVSSKPSMLVTHTIFSTFGKIRYMHYLIVFQGLINPLVFGPY